MTNKVRIFVAMNDRIRLYHTYACREEDALRDETAADLDVDGLFECVDYTSSYVGKQYLYHLLHQDACSGVRQQEDVIRALGADPAWRKRICQSLGRTGQADAGYICSLFSSDIRTLLPRWVHVVGILRFLPLCWLGLIVLLPHVAWLYLLVLNLLVHFVLHYQSKRKIYEYYYSIPQTRLLLRQAEELVKEERLSGLQPAGTRLEAARLRALRQRLRAFSLGVRLDGDFAVVAYTVVELVNIFFLGEYYAVHRSLIELRREKKWLETVFCFVGLTDVLCSLSFLREKLPRWCSPTWSSAPGRLRAEDISHPLVKNAVPNSFSLTGKSALITGSNMCGKTCFIRTVGINILTAKALNTCWARVFAFCPDVRLLSSIRHTDRLSEGKSLFLQEALDICRMLEVSAQRPCLLLIDEPFGGTNGVERIAICTAVLGRLAESGSTVFVTTHDWELQQALETHYECYHFSEQVGASDLSFDYRLRKGKNRQGNAVRILGVCGYPPEVVERAGRLVDMTEGTGKQKSETNKSANEEKCLPLRP